MYLLITYVRIYYKFVHPLRVDVGKYDDAIYYKSYALLLPPLSINQQCLLPIAVEQ